MKVKRHNKILEIIEKYNVETQEELINKLKLAGFQVTQATISRDIRELGLLKVLSNNGTYKYTRPSSESPSGQALFTRTFSGTVKTINDSDDTDMGGGEPVFMVITQTGEFRVKGTLDEMSIMFMSAGTDVIIRSRIDETQTWKGTVTKIEMEPQTEEENDNYYGDSSGDRASKYPFYVQLESMDGLILGQHVFIEMDYGQSDRKGIWLNQEYIFYDEEGNPFIWAADSRGRIEKREVVLGESDDESYTTEIVSGISTSDRIAWPEESIREGMPVTETMPEYEEPEGGTDQPGEEAEYPEGGMEYPEAGTEYTDPKMESPEDSMEEEFPEADTEAEGE